MIQTRAIEGNFEGKGGEWQVTQENQVIETRPPARGHLTSTAVAGARQG